MASGLAAGFRSAQLAGVKERNDEDLELDEAALFDDDDDQDDAEEGEEAHATAAPAFAPHQGSSHDAGAGCAVPPLAIQIPMPCGEG